ncbi:MAG: flippase-like domain-containing protein [Candidatus Eisenbacteria bacterium]|uniref:Flippase-like domain-containing protein n=1 Tax=Eiseniibacteriota bacterium TaxID=2212470 RepID=A0A933SJN6_UNCEI|nr:flippase-like domain-containing protein [Candidatus Eisenbacteria bacterium]
MKRAIHLAVAIAISAVCVWVSMKEVDLALVTTALKNANRGGFVAVMVITIFAFWVRAIRWNYFLRTDKHVPLLNLFSATMIGFMANNVLPFRLGEFIRPWALARREGLSKSMLIATIVVERVVDMLTLLTIFGIALMVAPISEDTAAGKMVQGGARILLTLSVALTVFVVAAERNRKLAQTLVEMLPEKLHARVAKLLDRFLDGFALFRDFGKLVQVFALSFGMFGCFAVALWITAWSLGIALPWYAGLVMLVVTAIGIMVPAAPGYVGTLNIACTAGLALYGVGKAPASAFGWFYFFSQWLPITTVGLIFLNREGLSLQSLGEAQKDTEAPAA